MFSCFYITSDICEIAHKIRRMAKVTLPSHDNQPPALFVGYEFPRRIAPYVLSQWLMNCLLIFIASSNSSLAWIWAMMTVRLIWLLEIIDMAVWMSKVVCNLFRNWKWNGRTVSPIWHPTPVFTSKHNDYQRFNLSNISASRVSKLATILQQHFVNALGCTVQGR